MESFRQDLSSIASSAPGSSPSPPGLPTNDDIEAVIQLATSSLSSGDARQPPGKDTRTQLFVGNLPFRIRWQDLKDLFRKAGTVLRADVSLGPDNRSRGYGTVLLATAEDAGRAIDMFNGYSWQTRTLEVRPDRIPSELALPGIGAGFVVSGPNAVTSSMGGAVYGSNLIMASGPSLLPTSTNAHRDFDFSSFLGSERPGSTNNSSRTLFIGNLPFHCQWQDLKDLFRQAGPVVRADVALGLDGRSRGYGTVVLASEADADRAVKMFNGYEYSGRILKVHYDKFSQSGSSNSPPGALLSSFGDVTPLIQPDASAGLPFLSGGQPFMGHLVNPSMHIQLPMNYVFEHGNTSGPVSPYEAYPPFQSHPQPRLVPDLHTQSRLVEGRSNSSSIPSVGSRSNTDRSRSHSPTSPYVAPIRSHHHAHPGHISLPPPPLVTSFSPMSHLHSPPMMSPSHLHHLVTHSHHTTPLGLPPITPSMPSFNFLPPFTPPAYTPNHHHGVATPSSPTAVHPHSHLLSPFSPGVTMSPGAFWGRPGGANPSINPAVGAPVHSNEPEHVSKGTDAISGSQDCSESQSAMSHGELMDYFPPVPVHMPNQEMGYFPPMPDLYVPPLLREKMPELEKKEEERREGIESTSPSDTDAETGERVSSSEATSSSWHTGDEMDIMASSLNDKVRISEGLNGKTNGREGGTFREAVEDVHQSEGRTHSRKLSLSPSSKKPVLTHRPDSDP